MLSREQIDWIESQTRETVTQIQSISGGSIASSFKVSGQGRPALFFKAYANEEPARQEAIGLKELFMTGAVRVPKVMAQDRGWLLMEWIESEPVTGAFWERFGTRLAALHSRRGTYFGFSNDNFIGLNPQRNTPAVVAEDIFEDWVHFFIDYRLRPQWEMAREKRRLTPTDDAVFEAFVGKLPERLIGSGELPSLLHGDLWSGNILCARSAEPVLIDPAVFYGHREAELAMTRLFGGFDERFYESYHEALPLTDGSEERQEIYQIYHLLNHWNLFGGPYGDAVMRGLKRWS